MLSEKRWPPEQVVQLLVRVFVSLMAGILIVSWVASTPWLGPTERTYLSMAIGTLSFHAMALVLTHRLLREQQMSWGEAFGLFNHGFWRMLLLAFLISMTVLPIALSLGYLSARIMTWMNLEPVVQQPVQVLQAATTLPAKIVIGLLAIVVAPLAEEVVFRGLLYPLLKQLGFPRFALWGNSILFATIHGNLMILLPLTFLALVLTLLYESTDDLLGPVFVHSFFNTVNFLWVIIQPIFGPGGGA